MEMHGESRGAPGGHPSLWRSIHGAALKWASRHIGRSRPSGSAACAPAEAKAGASFECAICLERTVLGDSFRIGCGHRFCVSCVEEHVQAAVLAGEIEVACPTGDCASKLTNDEILAVAGPEAALQLQKRAAAHAVETDPTRHYCPTADCGHVAVWDPASHALPRLDCPRCHKTACLHCKAAPFHEGVTCVEAKAASEAGAGGAGAGPAGGDCDVEMVKAALEAGNFRVCTKCGNGVEKAYGCFKMKCRCGFRFCFKCGIENANCDCTPRHHGFIDNRTGRGDFKDLRSEKSPEASYDDAGAATTQPRAYAQVYTQANVAAFHDSRFAMPKPSNYRSAEFERAPSLHFAPQPARRVLSDYQRSDYQSPPAYGTQQYGQRPDTLASLAPPQLPRRRRTPAEREAPAAPQFHGRRRTPPVYAARPRVQPQDMFDRVVHSYPTPGAPRLPRTRGRPTPCETPATLHLLGPRRTPPAYETQPRVQPQDTDARMARDRCPAPAMAPPAPRVGSRNRLRIHRTHASAAPDVHRYSTTYGYSASSAQLHAAPRQPEAAPGATTSEL